MEERLEGLDDLGPFVPTQPGVASPGASGAAVKGASSSRAGAGSWVESSWELRRGLVVSEGLPADAGLDEWLVVVLAR